MPAPGAPHAEWKAGNTRPSLLLTLNLGVDPTTKTARTLKAGDVVTQIMKNKTTNSPAIVRVLTVVDPDLNQVLYTPAVGDLVEPGSPEVEFDITGQDGGVETIPGDSDLNYVYKISAKLG